MSSRWGALLVALAACLWATDALVRHPAAQSVSPIWIVTLEHLISLVILVFVTRLRSNSLTQGMGWRQWLTVVLIGAGGSALATVLFTASFQYVNPSVSILIQKLQPLIVVALAYFALGDRPSRSYFVWGFIALVSALFVSFPHLEISSIGQQKGVFYSLAAAVLWAAALVAGKYLLQSIEPLVALFWRFFFGSIALITLLALAGSGLPEIPWQDTGFMRGLFYLALVPGLLSVFLYYEGLKRTSASAATLIELIFPVAAVALNYAILKLPLEGTQLVAGAFLLVSVTAISLTEAGGSN